MGGGALTIQDFAITAVEEVAATWDDMGGSMTDPHLEAERYLQVLRAVRQASKGVYLAVGSQALPPDPSDCILSNPSNMRR